MIVKKAVNCYLGLINHSIWLFITKLLPSKIVPARRKYARQSQRVNLRVKKRKSS